MTRNITHNGQQYRFNELPKVAASDVFHRASELPQSNFDARTLAQKLEEGNR